MVNGQPVVTGRFAKRLKIINGAMIESWRPDVLYLNDGTAHFTSRRVERRVSRRRRAADVAPGGLRLACRCAI